MNKMRLVSKARLVHQRGKFQGRNDYLQKPAVRWARAATTDPRLPPGTSTPRSAVALAAFPPLLLGSGRRQPVISASGASPFRARRVHGEAATTEPPPPHLDPRLLPPPGCVRRSGTRTRREEKRRRRRGCGAAHRRLCDVT